MPDVKFVVGRVSRVEERKHNEWVSGNGPNVVTREVSDGWFVVLDTGMSLGMGRLCPDCEPGDTLSVEFTRSWHKGEEDGR